MVLIQACANDVLEFRSPQQLERDLRATIARAKAMSRNVVLMPGHNFGVAPFFLRGISRVISWHGKRLYTVAVRVAAELGVTFVDLLAHDTNEHFVREPSRYYCPDGLHPSGDGYALWFATLVAQVPLARYLSGPGSD
jgi:lysophospholipase L1-like esterase